MKQFLFSFFVFILFGQSCFAQGMNNKKLENIFQTYSDTLIGTSSQWEIIFGDLRLYCITDKKHNRMRIISPIKMVEDASKEEILSCMEANFHTALDVKYSISDDIIWVAFIHPLKELTKGQVIDALTQIRAAVITYGTTYSSTNFFFPKNDKEEKKKKKKDTKRS